MRLFEYSYNGVRIFSERPYGYKRYIVDWGDGRETMYSGLWYKLNTVRDLVKKQADKIE
jgi:hypothetical protein